MTRSRRTAREVRGWLAICSAIATAACGPQIGPPDANNPAPPNAPTDTAAYRARVAQFPASRVVHHRSRNAKCPIDGWCGKVIVDITALGTTSAVDPDNAPDSPVPVAHLVNTGKKTEKYYGLLPSESAEYDLWVNKKPGSTKAEWRVVGVMKKSGTLVYGEVTDLTLCHKYTVKPGASDADFAEYRYGGCNVRLASTSSTVIKSSLSFAGFFSWILAHACLLSESRTSGGWIECPNGCCT